MDVIGNDTIQMDKSAFENNVSSATQTARNGASLIKGDDDAQSVDNVLYISWYGEVNGITQLSKKYRIANLRVSNSVLNAQYILKLEESILEIDANIAKHPTDTGLQPRLNETLNVKIERKDEKEFTDISFKLEIGKFISTREHFELRLYNLDTGETLIDFKDIEDINIATSYVKEFAIDSQTRVGIYIHNLEEVPLKYEMVSEYGDIIIKKKLN